MTGTRAIGIGLLALLAVGFIGGGMVAMAHLIGIEWALVITASYVVVLVFALALGMTAQNADRHTDEVFHRHRRGHP